MEDKLSEIDNFLIDIDGTLCLGGRLIDGAREFLDAIRSRGKRLLLLTNNSSASAIGYHKHLSQMGIRVKPEEVFTSATATIIYLNTVSPGAKLYLLATPSVQEEFRRGGFELTEDNPDFVVLTFDKTLTYEKLEKACRLLLGGAAFIATHPDVVCPTEDLPIPDCGAMTKAIVAATGIEPKVIGKPNEEMIASTLERLGATAAKTAIVGDRLYTDMEMGFVAGLTTVLVLSGEATAEDVAAAERKPDYVLGSVRELVDLI